MHKSIGPVAGIVLAALSFAGPARAHPHVFIDGGVDFVLKGDTVLDALKVTWLYDEFETLYILSSYELGLNAKGSLDEADRQKLIAFRSDWPDDFDGSAHLTIDGVDVVLQWPMNLDVQMTDGRLEVSFFRRLDTPTDIRGRDVEVAFYESTYFYAFHVTNPPDLLGEATGCSARVIPFDADMQMEALQATLRELSREETPDIANVGALFADRIKVRCD